MKPFVKVTGITTDFFTDREYEQDIIIGINQISAIYEEQIVIGEDRYVRLTPKSMKRLKANIEYADFTSKGVSE